MSDTKKIKAQARHERLQKSLRDNLRRRKSQVKQRGAVDDIDAPLPRKDKIGLIKIEK